MKTQEGGGGGGGVGGVVVGTFVKSHLPKGVPLGGLAPVVRVKEDEVVRSNQSLEQGEIGAGRRHFGGSSHSFWVHSLQCATVEPDSFSQLTSTHFSKAGPGLRPGVWVRGVGDVFD